MPDIPRFGVFETALESQNSYTNPYTELSAQALLTRPDGSTWTIPLFWDGGRTWRCRVSPDLIGEWSYRTKSPDPGLNSQGSFTCVPSRQRGSLIPMKGQPYHFQYQNGEPMWFFGETAWSLFGANPEKKLSRETVQHFVDVRAAQGFNFMHAMLMTSGGDGGHNSPDKPVWKHSGENEGGLVFEDFATEKLNPRYFQEADERLRYTNSKGITCGIVFSWGYGWPEWDSFPDDEARLRFARYVVARYSAFDTILIISGEWNPWNDVSRKARYLKMGEQVADDDPHKRMRCIHPWPSLADEFGAEPWCSFSDYQQNFHELHARALASRRFHKPVVNSEYGYHLRDADGDGVPDKDNSHSLLEIRHATWDIVMAGAYFVTGFGSTYYGGWRDPGPFHVDAAKNDDFEDDIQHVRRLFTSLQWWKLEPNDAFISAPGVGYCLAQPGHQYVAYVRECTGPASLALQHGGRYRVRRFDPREGTYANLPICEGGKLMLPILDQQDWVFVVEARR